MHTSELPPCPQAYELINAVDESVATIQHLSELWVVIDGHEEMFANLIEILSLIEQHASHVERLMTQLAGCVFPRPRAVEGQP